MRRMSVMAFKKLIVMMRKTIRRMSLCQPKSVSICIRVARFILRESVRYCRVDPWTFWTWSRGFKGGRWKWVTIWLIKGSSTRSLLIKMYGPLLYNHYQRLFHRQTMHLYHRKWNSIKIIRKYSRTFQSPLWFKKMATEVSARGLRVLKS